MTTPISHSCPPDNLQKQEENSKRPREIPRPPPIIIPPNSPTDLKAAFLTHKDKPLTQATKKHPSPLSPFTLPAATSAKTPPNAPLLNRDSDNSNIPILPPVDILLFKKIHALHSK